MTIQELLCTGYDGTPAEPSEIIDDAFDSPRYLTRVQPLARILADEAADRSDRFLACCALTTWAEEAGYRAVIGAARDPDATAWLGTTIDRLYSVDDSFLLLLDALRSSADLATSRQTEDLRVDAIRSVLTLLPEWYLGRAAADALQDLTEVLHDDARGAVERGIARLDEAPRPPFETEIQIAAIIAILTPLDDTGAVLLADRLLEVADSAATMRELSDVVAYGDGPASLRLGERLRMTGDEFVRREIERAMQYRHKRQSG